MMKKIVCLAAASALMAMGGAFAQDTADKDRDVRKDNRDIPRTRRTCAATARTCARIAATSGRTRRRCGKDQASCGRKWKEGDKAGAAAERREVARDKADLRRDEKDVRRDRKDVRADKRDLRKDRASATQTRRASRKSGSEPKRENRALTPFLSSFCRLWQHRGIPAMTAARIFPHRRVLGPGHRPDARRVHPHSREVAEFRRGVARARPHRGRGRAGGALVPALRGARHEARGDEAAGPHPSVALEIPRPRAGFSKRHCLRPPRTSSRR